MQQRLAKSLIIVSPGRDGSAWYRLLEPLRQYAEDALATAGRTEPARDAHLEHYLIWARRWASQLPGPGLRWKHEFLDRLANLRSALNWGLQTEDGERTIELIRHASWARFLFQINEVGDWAQQALDLADITILPDAIDVLGCAAMARWQRADLEGFHDLVNLLPQFSNRDPARHINSMIDAFTAALEGRPGDVESLLDRIERSNPLEDLNVSYSKFAFTGAGMIGSAERSRLQTLWSTTNSPLAEAVINIIEAARAFEQADFEQAAQHSRTATSAAASVGANYFAHMGAAWLTGPAGALQRLSIDDARLLARTLREQQDHGQENEQWIILSGLALWLFTQNHTDLAIEIRKAFRSTIYAHTWDQSGPLDDLPWSRDLEQRVNDATNTPDRTLHALANDTLATLDHLVAAELS